APVKRWLAATAVGLVALVAGAGPAAACGGLIGPRGSVNLVKTTTLAGYHDGVEHYVTAFKFLGAGGQFGSIVPLPGVPTKVERGGDWTLQRLVREVQPPIRAVSDNVKAFASAGGDAADPRPRPRGRRAHPGRRLPAHRSTADAAAGRGQPGPDARPIGVGVVVAPLRSARRQDHGVGADVVDVAVVPQDQFARRT